MIAERWGFDGWDAEEALAVVALDGTLSAERGATLGSAQVLWPHHPEGLTSATSDSHAGVAVWKAYAPRRKRWRVYAALRGNRGRFGRPVALSGGARSGNWGTAAAINARGDAIAVWQAGQTYYARTAVRAGGFGPRVRVGSAGPEGEGDGYVSAAVDANGESLVAWGNRLGVDKTAHIFAARSGSRGFRRPFVLDAWSPRDNPSMVPQPEVHSAGPGEALVAWRSQSGARDGLRVATVTRSSASTQDVAGFRGYLDYSIATRPDGRAVAAWEQLGQGSATALFAAVRDPGGAFGPAEPVAPGQMSASSPRAAWNPVNGQPAVGFLQSPDGSYDGRPVASERRP
jgi:hypothetical protein